MTETVRCRTVDGTRHTLQLTRPDPDTPELVTVDGQPLLRKSVPRTDSGHPGPLAGLDREILATHRFAQLFPPDAYPPELPRLRYYDVDSEDPFVLLTPYRGVPVADVLPHMTASDRHRLQTGLLRALHLVGMAGMTHGQVGLDAVRWDPETRSVQLVGFEHAAIADIREDMWNAGLAIWRTAHPEHVGADAPDLDTDGGVLTTLLAGVFVEPSNRPTPGDLLNRLREPTEVRVNNLAARFRPGAEAYDSAVRLKRDRHVEPRPASWWSRFRRDKPAPTLVRCPVCLDSYPPPDDGLWRVDEHGKYHQLEPASDDPLKTAFDLVNTYRRCPNPAKDTPEHFLPANYFTYGPPLVVAMVGQSTAGKTHLLAAMVRQAVEGNGLSPYGLTVVPLDLHLHDTYRSEVLDPAARGSELPPTPERVTGPATILLVRAGADVRPLVLFDVAGEDLQAVGDSARFLVGINAVIFVHGLDPTPDRGGNPAVEMSLARFQAVPDQQRLPAAIVATKADRLRYEALVSRWLRHSGDHVNADLAHRESRDVYAFLHERQEHAALAPFAFFDRCTLHFTTASGGDADGGTFPRGFEPSRVLQPLVAILAMAGMLNADGIGT